MAGTTERGREGMKEGGRVGWSNGGRDGISYNDVPFTGITNQVVFNTGNPCLVFQRSLENLTSFQDMMIKSLFKFVQGAAHLWDLHELGLVHQERALQVNKYII
jgi:hypothetical protein